MKKFPLVVLMLALALSMASTNVGQDKSVVLLFSLQPGDVYRQYFLTEQTISQLIQGLQYDSVQTIGMGYTFAVEEVDADGNIWVEVIYDSTLLKQSGMGLNVEYDSSDPPDEIPPLAIGFDVLVGQGFTMKMSPQGHVLEIQGVEEMIDSILEQLDMLPDSTQKELEQSFRQQFGAEAIKENMQNSMAVYPEAPVKIGDSWSKTAVTSLGFSAIIETSWTLVGYQRNTAIIEAHSTIEPDPQGKPMDMVSMKISYDVFGEQQGTLRVNENTGWTTYATLTQNLSGMTRIEMTETGETMSWPITMESSISIETK